MPPTIDKKRLQQELPMFNRLLKQFGMDWEHLKMTPVYQQRPRLLLRHVLWSLQHSEHNIENWKCSLDQSSDAEFETENESSSTKAGLQSEECSSVTIISDTWQQDNCSNEPVSQQKFKKSENNDEKETTASIDESPIENTAFSVDRSEQKCPAMVYHEQLIRFLTYTVSIQPVNACRTSSTPPVNEPTQQAIQKNEQLRKTGPKYHIASEHSLHQHTNLIYSSTGQIGITELTGFSSLLKSKIIENGDPLIRQGAGACRIQNHRPVKETGVPLSSESRAYAAEANTSSTALETKTPPTSLSPSVIGPMKSRDYIYDRKIPFVAGGSVLSRTDGYFSTFPVDETWFPANKQLFRNKAKPMTTTTKDGSMTIQCANKGTNQKVRFM